MSHFFPISDPVLIFAIVTVLILVSPLILARWKVPGMIGLLLSGALLGPNALGILARDQSFVLLGTVGLIYIMFTAALEIDLAAFKRYKFHGITFGLITFGLPQTFGTFAAKYLFGFGWPAALLLGSVLASHTLLAYPIVSRLGIAKSKAVTTAVGATMITDIAALLVLAVIAGSARGEMNEAFWYRLGLMMVLYGGGILIGLPRLGRWFFRNVRPDGAAEFVFVLAAVFTAAALSHVVGVEPIVGAFLAGLALNRLIPHGGPLMSRIQFTGEAIFVPFFLLSVGMLLDVRIFAAGLRSWLVAVGMLIAVIAGKFLASEATRILLRFSKDEARLTFGLSVPQAAATLAATMVGYELHLFDEAVVNGAILMILVTCIVGPYFADRHGRVLAAAAEQDTVATVAAAQRVLVPLSSADEAEPLIATALLMRAADRAEPIYPLAVIPDSTEAEGQVSLAEKMLARSVMHLAAADVPAHPLTRIDVNVSAGILRTRRELRATHVVMSWSPGGSALFGSDVQRVIEDPELTLVRCRLPHPLNTTSRVVLVCPPQAELERSFGSTVATVKTIAAKLGAPMTVIGERASAERVLSRIRAVKPNVELTSGGLESWGALVQALADGLQERDLLVVYQPRPGGIAWRSQLVKAPDQLAARFPAANLMVLYAAEAKDTGLHTGEVFDPVQLLRPERTELSSTATSWTERVEALVQMARREPGAAIAATAEDLGARVQELVPGVVALRASAELSHPQLFALRGRTAVEVPGTSAPVRLAFLIVSPIDDPPERALHLLAPLARGLATPAAVEAMAAAETFEALVASLRSGGAAIEVAPEVAA